MANEITLTARIAYKHGDTVNLFEAANKLGIDVAANKLVHRTQTIGTSVEQILGLNDIGTFGYFIGVNRSASGVISLQIGSAGTKMIAVKPGEPCCFRINASGQPYPSAPDYPHAVSTEPAVLEYMVMDS